MNVVVQNLDTLNDRRVRQANALAKSGQELHVIEKRLLLIAISRIRRSDTELLTHRIPMTELEEHFNGNPYRAASRAATGLLTRLVTVKEDDGGFTAFNWTTLARYVPASQSDDGGAYIEIRLNEELQPYLLQLQRSYNTIPLLDVLPMASINSQRLYEILWHDSFAGDKSFLTYEIEDLKFQLGLRRRVQERGKQVWKEKYTQWRDFQKVLSRAQEDFDLHGRLRFDFTGIKTGKQTRQVRFRLWTSVSPTLPEQAVDTPNTNELRLISRLEEAGYLQDSLKAIREYGNQVVEEALALALATERKAANTNNPIQNLGGLIHHTLTTGLAKRRLERKGQPEDTAPDLQSLAAVLVEAFSVARATWADGFWEELGEGRQLDIKEIMRLELSSVQIRLLDKQRWQGAAFNAARREMLLSLGHAEPPKHLVNLATFVKEEDLLAEFDESTKETVLSKATGML